MRVRLHTLALLAAIAIGLSGPSRVNAQPRKSQHGPAAIRSIRFQGNQEFSDRELLELLSSRPSLAYSDVILDNDLRAIAEQYRHRGYLNAQAKAGNLQFTSDSSSVDLTIEIAEGRQSVLATIAFEGNRQFQTEEIIKEVDTKVGTPLDERVLEQDIENLLSRYEQSGYPFASCQIASMGRRQGEEVDSIDVEIRIDERERVAIEEIRVEGNKETRSSVIVRETRLKEGEIFSPAITNAIRRRLTRLDIFSSVAEPELYLRNNKGGLLIKVQEGNTSTFDGVIGYIPGTASGEAGYVTGLVSVAMRNLFGTGRKLSFRWQREDRASQELGIRYLEPWIFGFPANLGGGFFQRQQDSSYVRRVFDMKGELMLSEELSVSLLFGSESVIPSSDSTITSVFRSSTTTFGGEILYDTRNDNYSPTSGARYQTDYQYGRKRIRNVPQAVTSNVPGRATVQRFTLDLDFFFSPLTRQVIAVGLHGRELRSGHLEESEMFRFGGARTLRGYRENQFVGSRLAWMNTEYRFLLARRTFIYGFVDNGYYLRPADDIRGIPKSDALKVGYGIGVQMETALGNVGVSFALGQGDTFSTGKIHFGLINEF
jgi:outer membrane protein insertion porin family